MSDQIIGMQAWLATPPGQYLLAWERSVLERSVTDIFGYHALQLGVPQIEALRSNRMPHRWVADEQALMPGDGTAGPLDLLTDFSHLPFPAASLDLVVLPHTLEFSTDPHATLREVERVLVPEGRVVICGLNPTSLWGLRQTRGHFAARIGVGQLFLPDCGEFIGYWRLRDWLRLLGFEVEQGGFGCYRPALQSESWLKRFAWMDSLGPRWWTIFGAAYYVVGIKRVHGMRMLSPSWKKARRQGRTTVPAIQTNHQTHD